jgi:hypothetical protein
VAGLFDGIDNLAKLKTTESFEALAGLVIKHFADEEHGNTLPEHHLVRVTSEAAASRWSPLQA